MCALNLHRCTPTQLKSINCSPARTRAIAQSIKISPSYDETRTLGVPSNQNSNSGYNIKPIIGSLPESCHFLISPKYHFLIVHKKQRYIKHTLINTLQWHPPHLLSNLTTRRENSSNQFLFYPVEYRNASNPTMESIRKSHLSTTCFLSASTSFRTRDPSVPLFHSNIKSLIMYSL